MQRFVTPKPGRTPLAAEPTEETITEIINRDEYKLIAKLREFRPCQWVLTISQWYPEQGWLHKQYFMEPEELVRFKELFNEPR